MEAHRATDNIQQKAAKPLNFDYNEANILNEVRNGFRLFPGARFEENTHIPHLEGYEYYDRTVIFYQK